MHKKKDNQNYLYTNSIYTFFILSVDFTTIWIGGRCKWITSSSEKGSSFIGSKKD